MVVELQEGLLEEAWELLLVVEEEVPLQVWLAK